MANDLQDLEEIVGNTMAEKQAELDQVQGEKEVHAKELERQSLKIQRLQDDITMLEEGQALANADGDEGRVDPRVAIELEAAKEKILSLKDQLEVIGKAKDFSSEVTASTIDITLTPGHNPSSENIPRALALVAYPKMLFSGSG